MTQQLFKKFRQTWWSHRRASGLAGLVAAIVLSHIAVAQDAQPAAQPKPPRARPAAYEPPEINPELPNVLLLGDSISIGYTLAVRDMLEGKANVFRPATNCGPTTNGIQHVDAWVGDQTWDVIHFNFGLHDLKYIAADGKKLADPSDSKSRQQVPLALYSENLDKIVEQLKATNASLIWCQTTPVPEGSQGRVPGDEVRYNEAAAKVMAKAGGVAIHELYDYSVKHVAEGQRPANVHYTEAGSKQLAASVAESISQALANRKK